MLFLKSLLIYSIMINKIILNKVASYKDATELNTDKNVNLIYGLNGSGKSTLSEFFRNPSDVRYSSCAISPEINIKKEEVFVYNEKYVDENFYTSNYQKGIFSLSKDNVDASKAIEQANETISKLTQTYTERERIFKQDEQNWQNNLKNYEEQFWEIKTKYSGGDRVFAYCLTGHMGSKNNLLTFLTDMPLPQSNEEITFESLKTELLSLRSASGMAVPFLVKRDFSVHEIESDPIFKSIITGNKDSHVAKLIERLNNADWVKQGLSFNSSDVCPFCQRPYDNTNIIADIAAYFDEEYGKALNKLESFKEVYELEVKKFSNIEDLFNHPIISSLIPSYKSAFYEFKELTSKNVSLINQKIKSPSLVIELFNTDNVCKKINDVIDKANDIINQFNEKVRKKEEEENKIKIKFWNKIRLDYNIVISEFHNKKREYDKKKEDFLRAKSIYEKNINDQNSIIEEQQSKVVNLCDAINNINRMLLDMGIVDFRVAECSEKGFYRVVRGDVDDTVFKTLSEGERTIISVLYFIETCKGIFQKSDTPKNRIVVIDDPVSSLSTMYIFNIGRLIRDTFYPTYVTTDKELKIHPKCEQFFLLTHSMYFFYEMTEMSKDKRHASQKLFRISKRKEGSVIEEMHYEQIQSDYHTYWMFVKDHKEHPALVANCMRNIIEYFFNFVEKKDLNNVFLLPKFKDIKYQAFVRYINRESHSLGQNISDFKEFDYDVFMDAFKSVFQETGYIEHFKKMMKLK